MKMFPNADSFAKIEAPGVPSPPESSEDEDSHDESSDTDSQEDFVLRIDEEECMKIYHQLRRSAASGGLDLNSNEAIMYCIAAVYNQQEKLNEKITRLCEQVSEIKSQVEGNLGKASKRIKLSCPIFESLEEMTEEDTYPKDLLSWMKQEGGDCPKDHVQRVVNCLIPAHLLSRVNREGSNGKSKFPEKLEEFLKESAICLFPEATCAKVEKALTSLFEEAGNHAGNSRRRSLRSFNSQEK